MTKKKTSNKKRSLSPLQKLDIDFCKQANILSSKIVDLENAFDTIQNLVYIYIDESKYPLSDEAD